jgi:hypothetical protein
VKKYAENQGNDRQLPCQAALREGKMSGCWKQPIS